MRLQGVPKMTVEKRVGKPHRVPAPDLSEENMTQQFQDAFKLNNAAKFQGWSNETLDILERHISTIVPNVSGDEIIKAVKNVFGFDSFRELTIWVRYDMCSEVFNKNLKYVLGETQRHRRELGFIDGSGIGYADVFLKNLKPNIEKTFDVKWFYKVKRPLQYAYDEYGLDLVSIANHINPGHWSYCQGHITKSLTAQQTMREIFYLDGKCDREMLIANLAFGHGRDGNLIHFPMDTYAGGYNTKLVEWK